jgi:lambda repressor-like predicted transcriptional regulator
MTYKDFHPEDIKAAIRKRFGSLTKFEHEHGLALQAVCDLLRGRTSAKTAKVVNAVLVMEDAVAAPKPTNMMDVSRKMPASHRLNARAS